MKTTVIVPVYNRPTSLVLAVKSLVAQADSVDLDILIVDDGSTDETVDVIDKLVRSLLAVRSVQRENGGVTLARNTGLDHLLADTEIVTFLDSDDAMAEGRFGPDLALLKANPDIDVTYGNMVTTDHIDPVTLKPSADSLHREITSVHLSCGLFRRRLIDRIGPFDTALKQSEDTDYLLRIFESHTNFIQTPTVCHYYLRHSGNMTKDTEVVRRNFALAIMKSIQRRRADPTLSLNKPSFQIDLPLGLM